MSKNKKPAAKRAVTGTDVDGKVLEGAAVVKQFGYCFASNCNKLLEFMQKKNRTAFLLARMIAFRARWSDGGDYNPFQLAPGEAVLDYWNWGWTRGEFE